MTSTRFQVSLARRRTQPSAAPTTGPQLHTASSTPPTARGTEEETVQQAATHTPIYSALVRQWSAEHRTIPGDFDQEWSSLVDYASWRRRQPRLHAQEG